MDDATVVEVVLNQQQMELLERLRDEEGLPDVAAALRMGLRAYLAERAGVGA